MPGRADYWQRPNRRRLAAALQALARFHRAAATLARHDSAQVVSPGILDRQRRWRDMTAGGADRLEAAVRADRLSALARSGQHLLNLFAQLAPLVRPAMERATQIRIGLQPCVRDIWHDHVLLTGDEVTGLIDFGALRDESVAGDVARLLGSMVADDAEGWRGGLEAYESIRRLSDEERFLVLAFDVGNVALSGLQWLEWIYVEGRRFENPAQVSRRLDQILARMQSMLQRQGGLSI
jgi:Ser/Thr protein kinase RdoA (MazF antagonist)